ncbi:MAG: hydrogenase small subunit [Negativicutes bacterium]|nr:hydrogenase small subunit [Negativicutes bacterium]
MALNRRQFLSLCASAGAALGLSEALRPEILEAFAGPDGGKPPVIWLQGGSCSGCSISLLNSVSPAIGDALTKVISLKFHQTLMAANGEMALDAIRETQQRYKGEYILVVEGTVPVGADGRFATLGEKAGREMAFTEWVTSCAKSAKAVVAVGTCASFGGIPAASPNPTSSRTVRDVVPRSLAINIPGCPSHPDWVLGTLVHVLSYGLPKLDSQLRPDMFYGRLVHDLCERRRDFDRGLFATKLSGHGCLYKLGCKGPMAMADCPRRKFNGGTNWCVGAGSPCLACVEPGFPDATSPFFVREDLYGSAGTPVPEAKKTRLLGGEG